MAAGISYNTDTGLPLDLGEHLNAAGAEFRARAQANGFGQTDKVDRALRLALGVLEFRIDGGATCPEAKVLRDFIDNELPALRLARRIALMHAELSEALEALRAGDPPSGKIPGFESSTEELADTVIRILESAAATGRDVGGAVVAKHAFNGTREHRHGGKAF